MSNASRHVRALRFDGLTVRAVCGDALDLAWLEEFLTPWFEPADPADPACEVELCEDATEYAQLRRAGPRTDGAAVHCFWLDRGDIHLPLWPSAGAERVVFDQSKRVFYAVDPAALRVRIITAPANQAARFVLMRVIRELALIHARTNGQVLIHGAAVEIDSEVFLITGPKGAGKTSLLIAFLLEHGGRLVSNDRVVVRLDAGAVRLRGIPTVVSVRRQTLDAHPALRSQLERRGYDHRLTMAEIERVQPAPRWTARDSIDLSPAQLCALVAAPATPEGRLRGVLFPALGAVDGRAKLAALTPVAANTQLSAALLAVDAQRTQSELFFDLRPADRDRATVGPEPTLTALAHLASFELCPAAAGFAGRHGVAELVGLLRAQGAAPAVQRAGA